MAAINCPNSDKHIGKISGLSLGAKKWIMIAIREAGSFHHELLLEKENASLKKENADLRDEVTILKDRLGRLQENDAEKENYIVRLEDQYASICAENGKHKTTVGVCPIRSVLKDFLTRHRLYSSSSWLKKPTIFN